MSLNSFSPVSEGIYSTVTVFYDIGGIVKLPGLILKHWGFELVDFRLAWEYEGFVKVNYLAVDLPN